MKLVSVVLIKWQNFVGALNPVACALMAKMKIKRIDRPQVKLACLRQMSQLQLNQAQSKLISGFIDTYLRLQPEEEQVFLVELDKIEGRQKEGVMEIVTRWMQQGRQEEAMLLIFRQLRRRIGEVTPDLEQTIATLSLPQWEALGEALLDFVTIADLASLADGNSRGLIVSWHKLGS